MKTGNRMKYKVTVQRIEYREHGFVVGGATLEEAENNALEEAGDHDFRQNTVCHADEEVTQVVELPEEVLPDGMKAIWIGGENGVIEREEDLRRAAVFEQLLSDVFNPLPQPVYVRSPEEPGDTWSLAQSNYNSTTVVESGGEYFSEEEARQAADKLNRKVENYIMTRFPQVLIPEDWVVEVSNAARGDHPTSRSCIIRINGEAKTLRWKAKEAADTWIPKREVADVVKQAVAEAEHAGKGET